MPPSSGVGGITRNMYRTTGITLYCYTFIFTILPYQHFLYNENIWYSISTICSQCKPSKTDPEASFDCDIQEANKKTMFLYLDFLNILKCPVNR